MGRAPRHSGQGGRVSKAFCRPAGHRVAQHRLHAGVDGEPSTAQASSGEAGSAGLVSCSTVNDSSLNIVCLEDGLPAFCTALRGPARGRAAGGEGPWRVGGRDGQRGASFSGLLSRLLTARRFGDGPQLPSGNRGMSTGGWAQA